MVYTCYEMVRDCRANLPEGWTHFIANYVPVISKLLAHYATNDRMLLERVLLAMHDPQSSMFQSLEPAPERWLVAQLRQEVVAELEAPAPAIVVELESVGEALAPLTLLEKQAAWLETMRYSPAAAGPMLRVAAATVEKVRARAAELVRGKVDQWNRSVLVDNGIALGRAAAAATTKDCLGAKTFLDVLDGRMNWRGREELENHVNGCWHCIDHFCRMVEVIEVLRGVEPLADAEAAEFRKLLGIASPKRPAWKFWG